MELCDISKGKVYTKGREDVSIIKRGKEIDIQVH